jgi:hypothetical protein
MFGAIAVAHGTECGNAALAQACYDFIDGGAGSLQTVLRYPFDTIKLRKV